MGGGFRGRALTRARAIVHQPWPPTSRRRISPVPGTRVSSASRGGREGAEQRRGPDAGTEGDPETINTLYFLARWRDGLHWGSPNPAAESPGPRSDFGLPKARARPHHVGMSVLRKPWARSALAAPPPTEKHCVFSNRMSSPRRGCPAAMPLSTWLERTSSTPSEGQPGPWSGSPSEQREDGVTLMRTGSPGECQIEN